MTQQAGHCPKCGEYIEEWGSRDIDDCIISYDFNCIECGFEGSEFSSVKFSHFVDSLGNEIKN